MSCYWPTTCSYYVGKCTIPDDKFQRMCEGGNNPCERHEMNNQSEAMKDLSNAIKRKDYDEATAIMSYLR